MRQLQGRGGSISDDYALTDLEGGGDDNAEAWYELKKPVMKYEDIETSSHADPWQESS